MTISELEQETFRLIRQVKSEIGGSQADDLDTLLKLERELATKKAYQHKTN